MTVKVWDEAGLVTALGIAVALALAEALRRLIPPLRRLGLPGSILAGVLALLLGPQVLGWMPLSQKLLESAVYHGLALVFIAVALTPPAPTPAEAPRGASGLSMGFAVVTMVALQTAVGLAVVLLLSAGGDAQHPGLGLMLPLGFEQGPGQAMAMGLAWEPGLASGRQLGLIVAAVGFAWSVFVGVPLVAYGRWRGWESATRLEAGEQAVVASDSGPAGAPDPLAQQLVLIGLCYLSTLGLVSGAVWGVQALGGRLQMPAVAEVGEMLWGFHYIVGAMVGTLLRLGLTRLPGAPLLNGPLLGRCAGSAVDLTTACALAAVQLSVLAANWGPVVLLTTAGGLLTLLLCLYLAPRAFSEAPFEHAVVWFGMSTGTLPMGLALLRTIDPELRSPAPMSAVLGSAAATLGAIPVVLVLHPAAVAAWPERSPWLFFGLALVYAAVVVALWRVVGPLRLSRTWTVRSTPVNKREVEDSLG